MTGVQTCALPIFGVKHKTLHIKPGLGWVGKFCKKINLHEVRSMESNFRSIEFCRFRPINPTITRFQLLQINTLWASLNLDSMFWSWFANIIHNEVLIHLVLKVLEPNKLPLSQSVTKHITKMKCSKLQNSPIQI